MGRDASGLALVLPLVLACFLFAQQVHSLELSECQAVLSTNIATSGPNISLEGLPACHSLPPDGPDAARALTGNINIAPGSGLPWGSVLDLQFLSNRVSLGDFTVSIDSVQLVRVSLWPSTVSSY